MNHVNEARRTLTLELLPAGDGLSGRVFSDAGAVREFNGRVGLMHAIDELLVAPRPSVGQNKRRKE